MRKTHHGLSSQKRNMFGEILIVGVRRYGSDQVCVGERLYVTGGETSEGVVGDTWLTTMEDTQGGSPQWLRDFDPDEVSSTMDERVISSYVDMDGPVDQVMTLSADNVRRLHVEGIFTVRPRPAINCRDSDANLKIPLIMPENK